MLVVGPAFGLAVLVCRCWPRHGAVRLLVSPQSTAESLQGCQTPKQLQDGAGCEDR